MIDIELSLENEEQLKKAFDRFSKDIPQINRRILGFISEEVISTSQKDYLRGQALNRQSGTLANSLTYRLLNDWTAQVGTNVAYAAIHEYGGIIRPKSEDYLHFQVNGNWVKTKEVHMPERPYLRPALDDVFASGKAKRIGERVLKEELMERLR